MTQIGLLETRATVCKMVVKWIAVKHIRRGRRKDKLKDIEQKISKMQHRGKRNRGKVKKGKEPQ